jgi:hypothetical protein
MHFEILRNFGERPQDGLLARIITTDDRCANLNHTLGPRSAGGPSPQVRSRALRQDPSPGSSTIEEVRLAIDRSVALVFRGPEGNEAEVTIEDK